jgi:hypothetical protein
MLIQLQNGRPVKLLNITFCRETYEALCMLAPLSPNLTFDTEEGETVKLYQVSLNWRLWCTLNP